MNETLLLALVLIPCLVVAIVFHEVAHGLAALKLGDTTAKDQNRLSLNPIRHVDPVGTLLVPGALALAGAPVFGWAKPVPVLKHRLNNPRFGMMAVAAAGPGMNFVLAALAAVVIGVSGLTSEVVTMVTLGLDAEVSILAKGLTYFLLINVFLGVFNLLPIPPFDGSHIVEGALPAKASAVYAKLRPFGMLLFFALVAVTWFAPQLRLLENTIGAPAYWALTQYLGLASFFAG
jgi:Zn-dependent protease